ncbi:MAG: alpha/beta hydrolase [Actinobacteria bacterium]|nr:alpha/beta hydrolase [Actinomycetota bacterium]
MPTHSYRTMDVSVAGGALRVGVWDGPDDRDSVLVVHGVTASHRAWSLVAEQLDGVRVIAPDLRGRGRSNKIEGGAGLTAHANDLAAVLDALDIDRIVVVGHSMGAFVAIVFAHLFPERVSRLLLVDGGLPLDVPPGLDPDALVARILGPTAARLSMRFDSPEAYRKLWRQHPAFAGQWSSALEEYLDYDLVDDGEGMLRPATSYQTTVDDTIDMNTGTALPDALEHVRHPARLITVPFGLQNEPPGLYAADYLERILPQFPGVRHERVDAFNHYTIVMSETGAAVVAAAVIEELDAAR